MNNPLDAKIESKKKSIRSFVIRGGRITEGQKTAFDRSWPNYGLSLYDGLVDPDKVFSRSAPLIVEVGFGMGDSLLEMLEAEPDKDFVGIEVHPPGVGRLINNAEKLELNNLRVFMADATDVLQDCFVDSSIDRLQLYFPDPWHKKKHHKRRIVQKEFITLVKNKLKPGGIFHLATDWENYAEQMLELLNDFPGLKNISESNSTVDRPSFRPVTKFEKRGNRLGHGVWDLMFTKM